LDRKSSSSSTATVGRSSPESAPLASKKRKASAEPEGTPKSAKKVVGERFQRVKPDTKVDPRFASNQYVSYDYADRAHADLVVTKGKGFTKEKNKKKRGSYKGGLIDTEGGKGIKFDD
jgi:hypothetical protein